MKIMDYILIGLYVVITLVIAVIMLRPPSGVIDSYYLELQVDNEVYKRIDLPVSEETTIEIDTEFGHNIIKIDGMEVSVIYADCFDQVCVNQGVIKRVGNVIACLPSKLLVEIKGNIIEDDLDAVSH